MTIPIIEQQKALMFINEPEILFKGCEMVIKYFRQLEKYFADKGDQRGLESLGSIPELPQEIVKLEQMLPNLIKSDKRKIEDAYLVYLKLRLKQDFFASHYKEFKPNYNI